MTLPIIEITGLGKKYKLGAHKEPYLSIRDSLARTAKNFAQRLPRLPVLTKGQGPRTKDQGQSATDFWALRDVSFSVQQGECVGIIGRNGAGKSTLLKILSQITPPTEGKITCRGRIASLLEVGTGFHPELTGRENIYLNGAILGMTRAEIRRKFDEIVAFSEVEKFLDTPVKRYSSGMYVRLAFAVAAHLEPEILVVDEVLAVGDAQFQKKCLGKMGEVAKEGRTVLFVSHNMSAVNTLCKQGVLLNKGRIAMQGSIADCVEHYIGAHHSGEPIISHIERIDSRIEISQILINGTSCDNIDLAPNADSLEVILTGLLKESLPMELELRITDVQGTPLAFFSPGHEAGESRRLTQGPFVLRYQIKIPRILKGIYQTDIYLTNPGKNGWVDIPRAASLAVSGQTMAGGKVLDYSVGKGFILLESFIDNSSDMLGERNA